MKHTLHTYDFYCQMENTTGSRRYCFVFGCCAEEFAYYMFTCMLDFDSFDDHFRLQLPYLAYIHDIHVDPLQQKFGAFFSHISPSTLSKFTWQ